MMPPSCPGDGIIEAKLRDACCERNELVEQPQFDVTRERIRQIEAKALRKLRHPSRSELLRSFLEEQE